MLNFLMEVVVISYNQICNQTLSNFYYIYMTSLEFKTIL